MFRSGASGVSKSPSVNRVEEVFRLAHAAAQVQKFVSSPAKEKLDRPLLRSQQGDWTVHDK